MQPADSLIAVHIGHIDIQQDDIGDDVLGDLGLYIFSIVAFKENGIVLKRADQLGQRLSQ